MANIDRLEHVEDQLFHLGEALEHINQVDHCEDMVDAISDRIFVLAFVRDELYKKVSKDNERELSALKREYWRDVI